MKDFLKMALVTGILLALALIVRFAAFVHLHGEATALEGPAVIATADKR